MANFDTAREVLETSANSAGSAMAEHEKWSQSLEAKLTKLKSTWQSLSQSFLSSDFLKGGVDVITSLVDGVDLLIDKFGALPTLLGAFAGGMSLFKNDGIFKFDKDAKSIQLFNTNLLDLKDNYTKIQTAISRYNNISSHSAEAQAAYNKALANSTSSIGGYLRGLNGAEASMGGYISSLVGAKVASFALQAATVALNAALTMGISALISWGISALDKWIVTADELAEKVDEVTSKYKEQYEELQKLKGDYDTTNESSMISKYAELSNGVDSFGKNLSLTADEYSEYQNIVSTIADQFPSLVTGYNSQGNAILSCADNVGLLTEKYEELIHAQNREVLVNNAGDINKDFKNAVKDAESNTEGWFGWNWTKNLNLGSAKLSTDAAKTFRDILNGADAIAEFDDAFEGIKANASDSKELLTDLSAMSDLLEDAGFEKENGFLHFESDEEHVKRALEENKAVVKDIIDQYYADLETEIEGKKSQTQAALSEAFDISDSIYYGMSDTMKNIAYQVANGFDFEFFADLDEKGISVQEYVNNMLDQLNALSKSDNATIETAFNLRTQFNGGEISYGEYVEGLESTGSLIDNLVSSGALEQEVGTQIKLSLGLDEEGLVENYKTLTNRLKEIGLSEIDAKGLLDSLSAQELSVMTQIIPEIDADTTREQLQALIDKEMVLQGLNFDLNLEVESASIESLNTALAESVSATGLSSESIDALKSRYADLESQGWDLSSMFEETSHGIHLNRNELSKLENELSSQKLSEVNSDLAEMKAAYDELGEAIKNCTDPEKKAELFNDRQSLAQKISEAATLASQYQALTSAYNDWLAAEEAGNERDMYENVISGFETVKDELSRGWADDGTVEFLEMITGRTDLAGKSGKELKEVYDSLDESIKYLNKDGKVLEDTGYSVRDFFTVDDEGNSTSKGVYNFLDAIGKLEEEAFGGKDIVKRDGKGNIIGFDFELAGGDEAIAEALGVSEELVQIMVRAADDAGFVVSMDGTYKQLADLQNEAKAAANYLKEIGKTDFDFDFNTSSVSNIKDQLVEANKVLDKFKDKDGNIDLNADGATEAMQIVSTLQAKLDSLTQEQYGIGLTVEDDKYEDALSSLQNYGHTVAALNQLEINPKANAEEIEKLEADLDTYAQELNNLPDDVKVEIGLVGEDGKTPLNDVEAIKNKAESGEIKIPTTLDIQTNIDKNIEKLADLAWLNSGYLSESEEKTIKIKYGIEVEPEVNNPESVKEEVETSVPKNLAEDSGVTVETPVTLSASSVAAEQFLADTGAAIEEVAEGAAGQQAFRIGVDTELQAGEVKTDGFFKKIWEGIKGIFSGGNSDGTGDSGVAEGAAGRMEYSIGSVDVTVDEVDTSDVEEKTSETIENEGSGTETVEKKTNVEIKAENIDDSDVTGKTEELVKNESGKTETVEKEVELELNIGEVVDNLSEFEEVAKKLSELDGNISANVSANINGNVLDADGEISNLKAFAEGAKELDGAKSSYITVTANLEGNLDEVKNLDNLKTFAEGAKELEDAESTYVSVTAKLDGNLDDIKDIGKLKDFADGVKELKGAKDGTTVTATAKLDSNLDDVENLDNLKTFAEGVKELQNIKEKDLVISVTANLEGTLNDHKNISNLAEFVQNAKDLKDVKDSKVTITASLNGNLLEKTKDKIENLSSFAEGAKELKGAEDTTVSVTASLNGNFLEKTKDKLDNLKTFAEGAKALKGAENTDVSVTANASGNVFDKADDVLNNLNTFAKGAKALQDVEGSNVSVVANVNGNLASWSGSLSDLAQFAENAKKLQGVKSSDVSVNANISGNVTSDSVSDLERFASVVGALPSQAVTISVKASIDTANINSATDLLSKAANSGLFKDYNANIKVTYQKDSSEIDNYNPENLTRKVTYNLDSSAVDGYNPPNLTRTVTYNIVTVGGAGAGGGGFIAPAAGSLQSTWYVADGTAHADGTAKSGRAFKSGDWRTKDSGIALMGELGRELIVRDGRFYTVGDNGAGFFPYKKGDIIFNHKICGIA